MLVEPYSSILELSEIGSQSFTRRQYDSSGRRARAAASRRDIVAAARALFVERGYAATTIADVAAGAAVSAPTVYAGFGTKAQLLKAAIDVALAGDDEPIAVADRPLAAWVDDAESAAELAGRFAVMMGALAERSAPLYAVLVRAADAEPELAELLAGFEQQRLRAATRIARALVDRGGLPEGRTIDEGRDVIWVLMAPELYVSLTANRRWSTTRYVAWAANALVRLVLDPPSPAVGAVSSPARRAAPPPARRSRPEPAARSRTRRS